MTSAVKICRLDPLTPPEKHTGKGEEKALRRLYATRPYLSRETIVVSSPGEVFSLTEGLLMGEPVIALILQLHDVGTSIEKKILYNAAVCIVLGGHLMVEDRKSKLDTVELKRACFEAASMILQKRRPIDVEAIESLADEFIGSLEILIQRNLFSAKIVIRIWFFGSSITLEVDMLFLPGVMTSDGLWRCLSAWLNSPVPTVGERKKMKNSSKKSNKGSPPAEPTIRKASESLQRPQFDYRISDVGCHGVRSLVDGL